MKSIWKWLLLLAACTQFILTALPPGNGDLIGVQSAALDLSRGDSSYLYPGKDFSRNDAWVEHSSRNHRLLGDDGEPQWLMYPPLYPWLLSPLASAGAEAWRLGWAFLQFIVLFAFFKLIEKWLMLAGVTPDRVLLAALLLGSYPIARVFQLGQTSMLLALVLWGSLYAAEGNRRWLAPFGLGCAVFIKPFLLIVEIARAIDRKWKRGIQTLSVLLLLTILSIVTVGWSSQIEYFQFLRTLSGSQSAFWGNQSLFGALLRLFSDLPVLGYGFEMDRTLRFIGMILFGGFLVTAATIQIRTTLRDPIATPALWLSAVLLGLSLSWEHHAIILLPAVAWLWTRSLTATAAVLLAIATAALSLNLVQFFNDSLPGRLLAGIPALGRVIIFILLAAYHLQWTRIFKSEIT